MPTRRAKPNLPDIIEPDEGEQSRGAIVEIEETEIDRVAALLADVGSDARASIKLFRKQKESRKMQWCEDFTVAQFEQGGMSMIRNRWGPGEYILRLYGTNDNGNFGVLKATEIEIAESVIPVSVNPATSELSQVLAKINDQQQAANAAILQALAQKPDPMAQMTQMMSLMTMMREAMGLNINAQQQQPQKSSIAEIVDAVKELRGVTELISPKQEPESDMQAMLKLAGPAMEMVKTALAQRNGNPHQPLQITPPAAVQETANPFAFLEKLSPEQQQMAINELSQALDALLAMAQAQKPAIDGGMMLFEKLPDELWEFLDTPHWFEALKTIAPQVVPHEQWLRAAVAEALRLDDEDARSEETPADVIQSEIAK